jgi:hypothetical protein
MCLGAQRIVQEIVHQQSSQRAHSARARTRDRETSTLSEPTFRNQEKSDRFRTDLNQGMQVDDELVGAVDGSGRTAQLVAAIITPAAVQFDRR